MMSTLTPLACLERQQRLRQRMTEFDIDAVVLTDHRDIYYLTGMMLDRRPVLLMMTDDYSWLATYSDAGAQCINDCNTYEWQTLGTLASDPLQRLNAIVAKRLSGMKACRKVGWQREAMPFLLASTIERSLQVSEWFGIDDALLELQSRKDPDEIALIRESIQADLAAYTAVQKVIEPGANELDVLATAQHAAMLYAGQYIFHSGDYRSGEQAGPARNRQIERGELYIVDAWTDYGGYWCDLSRTYAVGEPTELQESLYEHIAALQRDVAGFLRPGLQGTELWRYLDERIREYSACANTGLVHHAGHGVGLRVHEMPDLNRDREGTLHAGNVVSVEPGGYTEAARCGVRLESMYLITESGAQNLSAYPMNLVVTK